MKECIISDMDNVAFQIPADSAYNPFRLLIAIEREGARLAFKARWRVAYTPELLVYLGFLVALGIAVEGAENESAIHRSEVA